MLGWPRLHSVDALITRSIINDVIGSLIAIRTFLAARPKAA
jgi:hypothetical protein